MSQRVLPIIASAFSAQAGDSRHANYFIKRKYGDKLPHGEGRNLACTCRVQSVGKRSAPHQASGLAGVGLHADRLTAVAQFERVRFGGANP